MAERTIKIRFDGSAKGLEKAANNAARKLDRFGEQAQDTMSAAGGESGRSFFGRFAAGFKSAVSNLTDMAASMGSGLARGIQSNPWIGAAIAAAIVGVAVVAMPAAGAALGAALVGGFGGAIAGLGLKFAAQTDKVQNRLTKLREYITKEMQRISKPLQGVWMTFADEAREAFDFISPALSDAFKRMAPALDRFVKKAFEGFKKLKPAIKPVSEAFVTLLDAIGPTLPVLMDLVAGQIERIAKIVNKNPQAFRILFAMIGLVIVRLIAFVGQLMEVWVFLSVTLPNALRSFAGWVSSTVRSVVSWFRNGFESIVQWVDTKLAQLESFMRGLPGRIVSAVGDLGSLLWDAGSNVIEGLIDGIQSKLGWLRDIASQAAGIIRRFFPFSPAKEGPLSGSGSPEKSGRKIGAMIASGMNDSLSEVRLSASGLAGAVSSGVAAGTPAPAGVPTADDLREALSGMAFEITERSGRPLARLVERYNAGQAVR